MKNRKEFYVDTPLGKLHVYEKADPDYPGVIVDLINPKLTEDDGMICCVEYEQLMERIQTVTYRPKEDEPTDIIINYEEVQ